MLPLLAETTITFPFNFSTVVVGLVLFFGGTASGFLGHEFEWKGFFVGAGCTASLLLLGWAMAGAFS